MEKKEKQNVRQVQGVNTSRDFLLCLSSETQDYARSEKSSDLGEITYSILTVDIGGKVMQAYGQFDKKIHRTQTNVNQPRCYKQFNTSNIQDWRNQRLSEESSLPGSLRLNSIISSWTSSSSSNSLSLLSAIFFFFYSRINDH